MTRFIFFAFCILLFCISAQAQGKFRKIRYAELTEAGIRTYGGAAKAMPEITLQRNRLVAGKGYALWANADHRLVVAPQDVSDPGPAFRTLAERRKYPLPGGGTLVIVCFCVDDEGMLYGNDDCHFDDSSGNDPLFTQCKGTCGCKRANGFEPDTPDGTPLVKEVQ